MREEREFFRSMNFKENLRKDERNKKKGNEKKAVGERCHVVPVKKQFDAAPFETGLDDKEPTDSQAAVEMIEDNDDLVSTGTGFDDKDETEKLTAEEEANDDNDFLQGFGDMFEEAEDPKENDHVSIDMNQNLFDSMQITPVRIEPASPEEKFSVDGIYETEEPSDKKVENPVGKADFESKLVIPVHSGLNEPDNVTVLERKDEAKAPLLVEAAANSPDENRNFELRLPDNFEEKQYPPAKKTQDTTPPTTIFEKIHMKASKLKILIEMKLSSVPDLFCVIFILSIYPLSIIRSATHFFNPYNVIASVCAILPISLVLTEVRYALYLLLEIPTDIEKPTPFNQRLICFLRKILSKVKDNIGRALILNSAYHMLVYTVVQGFSSYWFFYRSLKYQGLSHREHLRLMRLDFGDDFGDFFNFNTSCRQYLR